MDHWYWYWRGGWSKVSSAVHAVLRRCFRALKMDCALGAGPRLVCAGCCFTVYAIRIIRIAVLVGSSLLPTFTPSYSIIGDLPIHFVTATKPLRISTYILCPQCLSALFIASPSNFVYFCYVGRRILAASISGPRKKKCEKHCANVCVWLHATRRLVQPYTVEYFNIHSFYHVIPNLVVRNKPNLDCFQGKYRRSDAENVGSVCLMVREKIGLRTDRQTRR